MPVEAYTIDDFKVGQEFSVTKTVTAQDVSGFAKLSGDISPLHQDEAFATGRGFKSRVVYGVLLAAYLSEIIGVRFPGENCLLQAIDLFFAAPTYINDTIQITLTVEQISRAARSMNLKVEIRNQATGKRLATGKLQVGFTRKREENAGA
jgi:3-hydroxybutyryl-CoA dehydratase